MPKDKILKGDRKIRIAKIEKGLKEGSIRDTKEIREALQKAKAKVGEGVVEDAPKKATGAPKGAKRIGPRTINIKRSAPKKATGRIAGKALGKAAKGALGGGVGAVISLLSMEGLNTDEAEYLKKRGVDPKVKPGKITIRRLKKKRAETTKSPSTRTSSISKSPSTRTRRRPFDPRELDARSKTPKRKMRIYHRGGKVGREEEFYHDPSRKRKETREMKRLGMSPEEYYGRRKRHLRLKRK